MTKSFIVQLVYSKKAIHFWHINFEICIGTGQQDFFPYQKTVSLWPEFFKFCTKILKQFFLLNWKKYKISATVDTVASHHSTKHVKKLFAAKRSLRVFINNSTFWIVFQCPHDSRWNNCIGYGNFTNWRFVVFRHFFW